MSAPTPPSGGGIPGPGYYPDPSIPGYVRYWNGAAWVPGTSRRAPEGGEEPAAPQDEQGAEQGAGPAEHASAEGPDTPAAPADAAPSSPSGSPAFPEPPAGSAPADPAAPGSPADAGGSGAPVNETGPVFLDEEEPQDAVPPARGRHAAHGDSGNAVDGADDVSGADGVGGVGGVRDVDDVRDAAERAAAGEEPSDARGAWQAVDVMDVSERAGGRVAWGAQDPPALTVPAELGGASGGPRAGEAGEPRPLPGARRAEHADPGADAGAAGVAEERGEQRQQESEPGAPEPYEPAGPSSPLARDPRVGGGSWGEQVRRLAGPAPVPPPAATPGETREPGAPAADPREAASAYAPSPTTPDVPSAGPAPTAPDLPRAQPAPTAPDVPRAQPPAPTTPDLPQPRPAQPPAQPVPPQGRPAPPLTPAARSAPPAAVPQQQPAAQLPERSAARPELPQGGAGTGEPPVVPWRPPVNDPFLSAAQGTAPPAGLGRRLGARFVDVLLVGAVVGAVAVPLAGKSVDHVQDKIDAAEASGRTVTVWLIDGTTGPYLALVLGLFLALGLIVEALPTAKWGRTPGKRLFGVRVLDIESQDPPATGSALRRWLTYAVFVLLPVIGLLNVIWCAFDKPWRQCWHDKAGRTYVARG